MSLSYLLLPVVLLSGQSDEPIERQSLLPPAQVAWQENGFRVLLGYHLSSPLVSNVSLSGLTHEFEIDMGVRISDHWSLMLQLRYGLAEYTTEDTAFGGSPPNFSGLSYSAIGRAEYHFYSGLYLGAGLGLAGLEISSYADYSFERDEGLRRLIDNLDGAYTIPSTDIATISECSGTGLASQAMVGYRIFANPTVALDFRVAGEYRQIMCFDSSQSFDDNQTGGLRQLWTFGQLSGAFVIGFR